ncbi:unnamed protein product [Cylindrotheca closterium]|uniref:FAD-binding PCMH-type domain-containing protein n=1 Tax=Cylindrotheca closterium TaxID=2856 RepID=A0AAD2G8R9_9STRA|nr:unnamed protein product [Cylindrotheca closterium]
MFRNQSSLRRYANRFISRSSTALASLNRPTEIDVQELLKLLNNRPNGVLVAEDGVSEDLTRYNHDWTNQYKGNSRVVVRPQSTAEVSRILKYCNSRMIGVVPQGGNTALTGGSVPLDCEVVLSLEKMSDIHSLDPTTGILTCDAGCILQNLLDFAAAKDHLVPVDLGAKGTCQIGGNISTNAGGSFYFRYGSLHANVVGLEVVLANGDILDMGCTTANLKDNTGYDMKHLFIGAEGTLGIVTRAALLCPRLPPSRCTTLLACDSFDNVLNVLEIAKKSLGEILAAFEFIDGPAMNLVCQTQSKPLPLPASQDCPYYVLVESHGSCAEHDQAKMDKFLNILYEEDYVVDGVVAASLEQMNAMWYLRESCNPSCVSSGYVYKYDVSLPIPEFPRFVEELKEALNDRTFCSLDYFNWGHVIDGNLHCNVVCRGNFETNSSLRERIDRYVFEGVEKRGGSISAEHGLGQQKRKYMAKLHGSETLSKMYDIKRLFDPNRILNPGKYLPEDCR